MAWHLEQPGPQQAAYSVSRLKAWLALGSASALWCTAVSGAEVSTAAEFRKDVQPILKEFCYDCHADGAKKGDIAFDELMTDSALTNHELWAKVLKNVRAGMMPPAKKPQPSAEQREHLTRWIKYSAFEIDPRNPDPGRVTVRRLNRVEYRNTIRDLMGVDFNTEREFPPDDAGHGFDNTGSRWRRRRRSDAGSLREAWVQAHNEFVPQHGRPDGRARTGTVWRFDRATGGCLVLSADFESIFARLCGILRKHTHTLTFKESLGRCSLEGAVGPATLQAWGGKARSAIIPVAWVQIGKSAVSFHLMGLYGNTKLQDSMSIKLRARMHGKTCLNFKSADETLFKELEELTGRAIADFQNAGFVSQSSSDAEAQPRM